MYMILINNINFLWIIQCCLQHASYWYDVIIIEHWDGDEFFFQVTGICDDSSSVVLIFGSFHAATWQPPRTSAKLGRSQ